MINVDISNIWGAVSLPELLELEAEVFAAHGALMEGTGAGKVFRGWLELPDGQSDEELGRIRAAAERIRENSDVLVVIGTGGSCVGARGVVELLQGSNRNIGKGKGDPQIFFAGNTLSTRHWNELLHLLEGKDFSLCVISESGTAIEQAIAFRNLRWLLERRFGTDESRKRIYAVWGASGDSLRQMAREEGWESFFIPEDAGGRFSVLSAAGLLPMAAAGIDIMALLRGAREAKEAYDLRSYENPVWLYAAARNLLYRKGKRIELLESFEPGFRSLGFWWRQLFGGAEGKKGKGLFPAAAELPAELYGLGQLIQQGERNLFETMIRFDPPGHKMVIGEDVRDLDGLNRIAGKTMDYVEEMAFQAAVEAHTDGDTPMICIDCGELNPEKVGEVFRFFELACGVSAYVLGVNPFDQPGVEQYKEIVFRLSGIAGSGSL